MPKLRPKILYVEDNRDAQSIMRLFLKLHEVDLEVAEECEEALLIAERDKFDLFLLDSIIPGSSGCEVCRQLLAAHPDTPTFFYTGSLHSGERENAFAAGATEFIAKPHYEKLVAALIRIGLIADPAT
jgi:CheY-like chemotaxis protein